jgi:5-methylthioribose kinase
VADDVETLNPIETWPMNIDYAMEQFLQKAPYTCDQLNSEEHNDHALTVEEHYTNSYCNIVLETLYGDAVDKCSGAFLTEKTFKPIAYYHPFMVFGQVGVLKYLHELGFETFENLFDESYDTLEDQPTRLAQIVENVANFKKQDYDTLTWQKLNHNHDLFYNRARVEKIFIEDIVTPILEYAETR